MQTHCAHEAPFPAGRSPSGLRRLSLAMIATERTAEGFSGLPEGAARLGQVLATFKAAAPYLGIAARAVHAVDWLFKFTRAQDWEEGSRPVVWPSALEQRQALDLGLTQAKALNRYLTEAGLIVMKDSPNGKRYGRRDSKGHIVEAYGFDLSPLAARHAEFAALAAAGRAEQEAMRRLRRRATIARRGLTQILETVAELGLSDASWTRLGEEGRALTRSLSKVERSEEMAIGVASLERRQEEARQRLESMVAEAASSSSEPVDSYPKGSENRPHTTTTNELLNSKNTVMAYEEGRSRVATDGSNTEPPVMLHDRLKEGGHKMPPRTDAGTVMRLSPSELVRLAPRFTPYLPTSMPTWPEIVEAAEWLRHDLGVSQSLWGDACLAMGREQASIAIGIVSTKPPEHFTTSAAGYFHGMVAKAKRGQLNLARTIWGLRDSPRRNAAAMAPSTSGRKENLNS